MFPVIKKKGADLMDIFVTEDNRTYVTVDLEIPKDKAITLANGHFRISKDRLASDYGWIKKDTLYFEEKRGAKKVWLFWRKSKSEK